MSEINIEKAKNIIDRCKFILKERAELHSSIKYCKDLDYVFTDEQFVLCAAAVLTPQSYGAQIQNRYKRKNNYQGVQHAEDRGDLIKRDEYNEYKVSLITHSNVNLNVVQVRLWQKLDWYIVHCYDVRDINNIIFYEFKLSKSQMEHEIELLGQSAHLTKEAAADNTNVEYRLSIPVGGEVFNRWKHSYLVG